MAVVLASVAFWAPGTYTLAGDDNNPFVVPFRARFKRLKSSERRDLDRRLLAGRLTGAEREEMRRFIAAGEGGQAAREDMQRQLDAEAITDKEFLDLLLVDWDLKDLAKTVVPYTPAIRAELFEDWDGLEAAFVECYFDAIRTNKEAAKTAKNSAPLSATGS